MTDVNATLKSRANTHGNFKDNGLIMQLLKNTMRMNGRNWPHPTVMTGGNPVSISEHSTGYSNLGTALLSFEQCEALDMIQHKIGRILSGNPNEPDHWHDIAGYATLVENILRTGNSNVSTPNPEQTK